MHTLEGDGCAALATCAQKAPRTLRAAFFSVVAALVSIALMLSLSISTASAATLDETLEDSVFVNEPGSTGMCTIYAATNMLRRAALLNGDSSWDSITTSSIPSSGGLSWSFTVSTGNATYSVAHGYLTGSTEEEKASELKALLDENPAGIVLYAETSNPHAVTLLGYDEDSGTFIAHDSLTGETSSLDECVTVRVANATAYWYVTSDVADPDPSSLSSATITVDDAIYSGETVTPEVTVTLGSTTLEEGTDYTVSFENNDEPGVATVTVTGTGSYTGSASATFEISDGVQVLTARLSSTADTTATETATASQNLTSGLATSTASA